VILAILVLAAVVLTIALSSGKTAHTGSASGRGSRGNSSLKAAAAARKQAATWVTAQVSPSATVACDPVMCSALQIAGFPAGNLLAMSPDAGDPLGSAIVMSTDAIRSTLGSRLNSVYAPVVLASFGNQTARVDVRVTAADGARAYLIQLHEDLLARQKIGRELLTNQNIAVSAAARPALLAGDVDARLLVTLALLAGGQNQRVTVLAFSDSGPGASAGVPMRAAVIELPAVGKRPGGSPSLQSVQNFLRVQEGQYRAASMTVANVSGQPALRIEFAAPSPLGVLGAGASR
jgi:hypothetical protein